MRRRSKGSRWWLRWASVKTGGKRSWAYGKARRRTRRSWASCLATWWNADAVPITTVLGARTPELDRLNFEFDTISGDLAREDSSLRGVFSNGDFVFFILA